MGRQDGFGIFIGHFVIKGVVVAFGGRGVFVGIIALAIVVGVPRPLRRDVFRTTTSDVVVVVVLVVGDDGLGRGEPASILFCTLALVAEKVM